MLSEKKITDSETDWKKQYAQTLKELDIKEKEWGQQQQELLKTVLRLTFTFQGSNDILDKKLFNLKETLKQPSSKLPQDEINQIIESILKLKKDKNTESSRTNLLITSIVKLLSSDEQFNQYSDKLLDIKNDIQDSSVEAADNLKSINNVIANINKDSAKGKHRPDTFKVFLKKLSDDKSTESELAALCKRSIVLTGEQEKLKAINQCIEKINSQAKSNEKDVAETVNNAVGLEHLVTLLDWITIPGKSQKKLESLKQQLEQRTDGKEAGSLLRRIALVISNAYMEIQAELNETEDFLKKVTHQLNEITLQVVDIESLENE